MKKMKWNHRKWNQVLCLALAVMLTVLSSSTITQAAPKGYVWKYKKTSVTIHDKASAILSKAGKPVSKSESKSCAYKGMDRTYKYKDFIITTYSNTTNGTEYVNSIELTTSKVQTSEKIKIGSSKNSVIDTYGKGKSEFGVYTFTKGKTKLMIEIDSKNKVSSITYMAK